MFFIDMIVAGQAIEITNLKFMLYCRFNFFSDMLVEGQAYVIFYSQCMSILCCELIILVDISSYDGLVGEWDDNIGYLNVEGVEMSYELSIFINL